MFIPDRELMPLLRDALAARQRVRMPVTGRSMWPFICDGDVVELAPTPSTVSVGMIALAQLPNGRYPLHRLVARSGPGWLLRGDNRGTPDGVVTTEHLLGVAVCVERHGHVRQLPVGCTQRCIAWLSRHGWLTRVTVWLSPRRVAQAVLRRCRLLFTARCR